MLAGDWLSGEKQVTRDGGWRGQGLAAKRWGEAENSDSTCSFWKVLLVEEWGEDQILGEGGDGVFLFGMLFALVVDWSGG